MAFAHHLGVEEAVALSSGTAGMHATMHALNVGPGQEVIVSPMTFVASANCVVFQGGTPVFADVDPETLLLDPTQVEAKITPRTRAIISVDYAGQSCDYDDLRKLADLHGIPLVADACHSLGASYGGKPVGCLADLSVFSLHPVKHITAGEGGVVTTGSTSLAQRIRAFRNHAIYSGPRQRQAEGLWYYEMKDLGYNYRLSDFQCALAASQLRKLSRWVERRQAIASLYDDAFSCTPGLQPLRALPRRSHSYHLYVVKLDLERLRVDRDEIFQSLRASGIGVNVHYIPVHLHPYYRRQLGTVLGLCPAAEAAYNRILSLPIFPSMTDHDVERVVSTVTETLRRHTR